MGIKEDFAEFASKFGGKKAEDVNDGSSSGFGNFKEQFGNNNSNNSDSDNNGFSDEFMKQFNGNATGTGTYEKVYEDGSKATFNFEFGKKDNSAKSFSYGSGDTTVRGFAQRFFGNDAEANLEGIAKTVIPDFKAEKGADIGSYTFNASDIGLNEFKDGKSVGIGRYLANYLNKFNAPGMDDARTQAEQKIREGINDMSFNSSNVMSSFDQTNKYNVRHRNINRELDAMGSSYDINFLKSDNVKRINKKLNSGESLSASKNIDINGQKVSEVDIFNQVKNQVNSMKGQFAEILANNGYEADNPFDSDFGRNEGQHQVAYKAAYDRQEFLNYDVNEKGVLTKIENPSSKFNYLSNAEKLNDFKRAEEAFMEDDRVGKVPKDFYGYLEKNEDAFYGSDDAKALYNLHKSGAKLGIESENVLFGFAASKNIDLKEDNAVIENLKSAATQELAKYNIDTNNVQYLKEGGLQLTQEDGKFKISQQSIDLMTDDEKKKYQKLIDSNDVGKENLSEISGSLDRRYRENKVLENVIQQETKYETTSTDSINLNSSAYYGNNNDMNTTLSYRANTLEEKFGTQENNYNDAFNNFYEKNKDKTIEELSSINTSYNAEGINDPITSMEIGSKTESYIPEINDFQDYYEKNKDIPLNRLNEKISDGVNIDKSDVINNYGTGNLRYNYDIPRDANQKMNVGSEYLNSSNYTSTKIEAESVSYNINHGKINSFEDIRKGASSNYDRITKSYASEDYKGYSLTNDEVLNKSGITDEKLRKEILGAKNFDDLSPEAMGALYGANTKLSQRDINLGNFKELSEQEIESIEKMNPELGKKLRDISAGDKTQILGRTQEEVSKYLGLDKDGLTSKLEMKRNASLDINDPKVARKVLEDLSNKNPEEALADLIDFTGSRKGYGDFNGGKANKVLDAFRAGTLEKDLRSGRLEQAYGIVRDTIDEIKSIHGKDFAKEYDQFDAKTENMKDKFSVENMKKQAKNFTKEDYDRIDSAFDKGLEATAKRVKNLSGPLTKKSGNLGKAFDFFGSGKGKVALGVAGGMAAIFGVASIAGNAAEERERKRQEMNQLIAAQNANIRSGY